MMRVLLDTDVILDFLLDRPPFADAAAAIWEARKRFEGYISVITPVNVFYITRKIKDAEFARQIAVELFATWRVCPLDLAGLQLAAVLPMGDFEDAVQCASAIASQLDAIVTRNVDDYAGAAIPVLSPPDFLKQLLP